MPKELCSNCSTKLAGRPFCSTCGRPTRYANDDERLAWDLGQWRAHLARSSGSGKRQPQPAPAPVPDRAAAASTTAPTPNAGRRRRRVPAAPKPHPRLHLRRSRPRRDQLNDAVDIDNPYAYRACTICGARDWIVRTTRNDDGTYNYWCVRCSRSFRSPVRIPNAVKPFVTSGVIVAAVTSLSLLMR